MSPELSRRLGQILGRNPVQPQERRTIIDAAQGVETWDELPDTIRALLDEIKQRGEKEK